jgi:iron complex transport system substrate-binding protein
MTVQSTVPSAGCRVPRRVVRTRNPEPATGAFTGRPRRAARLVVAALVLSLPAACGRGTPPAKADAPSPQRIVSLVPAVTEMLFAIGAGPRVVAVSSFDHWPPEVSNLTRVGGLLDPDIERILSLKPDLLVADASQAEVLAKAKAAGIRVYSYTLGGLDNLGRTMRELAGVVGTVDQGETAAAAVDQRLADIRKRVAGLPRPRTLLVFGREPGALRAIDVSGGIGFLHDIVQLAGGENVFGREKREWVRVSVENIVAAAPEVIIELHYGYYLTIPRLKAEMAVWNTLTTLPAVRNHRVHLFEGDKFVVPGPRLVEAAAEIAAVIHPVK